MASPFPYPPQDGQVFDHPNGIEYQWSDAENRWNIVYGTATNTGSLPLLNPTSYQSLPSSVPDIPAGTIVQADFNKWLFDSLQHVNKEANIEVLPAPGPTDPDDGRLWYDSNNGRLYLYYNDGNSTQWVEVGGGADDFKEYVDQQDEILANQIIELEEEIEALVPSLERGQWNYNPIGSASTGQYSLYDSDGNITSDFNSVATIFINTVDSNSITHGFADVKAGIYLEIFQDTDADYGVYVVTDVDDQTGGNNSFWSLTVDFVRSNSLTSTAGGLARFKIFEAPDGGSAGDFIKSGGTTNLTSSVVVSSTEGTNDNFSIYGGGAPTTFYVRDKDGTTNFRIKGNGQVQAGPNESTPFIATEDHDLTTKKYVDDNAKVFATLNYVLQLVNSSSLLTPEGGDIFVAGSSLMYRKAATTKVIPELKVGDQLRVIKQNGSVLILEVTSVQGMVADWFSASTKTLSSGVSLTNNEFYDFNFMFA